MGYKPKLIIKKADLYKHRELFESFWLWDKNEDEIRVMEYLKDVLKGQVSTIDNLELLICCPEYSTFNRLVREKLTELNVQFSENN